MQCRLIPGILQPAGQRVHSPARMVRQRFQEEFSMENFPAPACCAQREQSVRLWFEMWLRQRDLGMDALFTPDAVYIESWGPEYHGVDSIRRWFCEWNAGGTVLQWEIRQFFHREDQTVVEWFFKNTMSDGRNDAFEGMSLIRWSPDGRMTFLKEFVCTLNRYPVFQSPPAPHSS